MPGGIWNRPPVACRSMRGPRAHGHRRGRKRHHCPAAKTNYRPNRHAQSPPHRAHCCRHWEPRQPHHAPRQRFKPYLFMCRACHNSTTALLPVKRISHRSAARRTLRYTTAPNHCPYARLLLALRDRPPAAACLSAAYSPAPRHGEWTLLCRYY